MKCYDSQCLFTLWPHSNSLCMRACVLIHQSNNTKYFNIPKSPKMVKRTKLTRTKIKHWKISTRTQEKSRFNCNWMLPFSQNIHSSEESTHQTQKKTKTNEMRLCDVVRVIQLAASVIVWRSTAACCCCLHNWWRWNQRNRCCRHHRCSTNMCCCYCC